MLLLNPIRIGACTHSEYLKAELKDVFAMADVVVSRAGANAICELLALKSLNHLQFRFPQEAAVRSDTECPPSETQGIQYGYDEDYLSP